jgi:hypothetical protein
MSKSTCPATFNAWSTVPKRSTDNGLNSLLQPPGLPVEAGALADVEVGYL